MAQVKPERVPALVPWPGRMGKHSLPYYARQEGLSVDGVMFLRRHALTIFSECNNAGMSLAQTLDASAAAWLRTAIVQMTASDDQIICGDVRKAFAILTGEAL